MNGLLGAYAARAPVSRSNRPIRSMPPTRMSQRRYGRRDGCFFSHENLPFCRKKIVQEGKGRGTFSEGFPTQILPSVYEICLLLVQGFSHAQNIFPLPTEERFRRGVPHLPRSQMKTRKRLFLFPSFTSLVNLGILWVYYALPDHQRCTRLMAFQDVHQRCGTRVR